MAKGSLEKFAEEFSHALRCLNRDISSEAVRHDHIDGPGGDVVSFDEPVKVNRRKTPTQAGGSFADGIVPFQILRTNVEQTDRRFDQTENRPGEDIAHQGELNQIFG